MKKKIEKFIKYVEKFKPQIRRELQVVLKEESKEIVFKFSSNFKSKEPSFTVSFFDKKNINNLLFQYYIVCRNKNIKIEQMYMRYWKEMSDEKFFLVWLWEHNEEEDSIEKFKKYVVRAYRITKLSHFYLKKMPLDFEP